MFFVGERTVWREVSMLGEKVPEHRKKGFFRDSVFVICEEQALRSR